MIRIKRINHFIEYPFMIKIYKLVFLTSIILLIAPVLSSAQGPTMGENSFQISGDGFKNQLIRLGIKAHEFENNFYARASYNYLEEYQNMTVRISGANQFSTTSPITGIHMDFNSFTKPGMYTTDSAITVSVFFKKDIPANNYDLHYMMDSDGMVDIKKYEGIGGLIEGTFSGTFVKMRYNKLTGVFEETEDVVTITKGIFSVIHSPDYHWDSPQSTGTEPEGFSKKDHKKQKVENAK